jgi:hypothetical protein
MQKKHRELKAYFRPSHQLLHLYWLTASKEFTYQWYLGEEAVISKHGPAVPLITKRQTNNLLFVGKLYSRAFILIIL